MLKPFKRALTISYLNKVYLRPQLRQSTDQGIHFCTPLIGFCTLILDKTGHMVQNRMTIIRYYYSTLNRRKILAVTTQLKQLRKESLKKIQAWTGFEPTTTAMPVQCSTNWAIKHSTHCNAAEIWSWCTQCSSFVRNRYPAIYVTSCVSGRKIV